jgi:hypothetical protein
VFINSLISVISILGVGELPTCIFLLVFINTVISFLGVGAVILIDLISFLGDSTDPQKRNYSVYEHYLTNRKIQVGNSPTPRKEITEIQ